MLLAVVVAACTIPASAAAGKVYAHMKGIKDEDTYLILATIFPPFGAFCAINILLKEYEK